MNDSSGIEDVGVFQNIWYIGLGCAQAIYIGGVIPICYLLAAVTYNPKVKILTLLTTIAILMFSTSWITIDRRPKCLLLLWFGNLTAVLSIALGALLSVNKVYISGYSTQEIIDNTIQNYGIQLLYIIIVIASIKIILDITIWLVGKILITLKDRRNSSYRIYYSSDMLSEDYKIENNEIDKVEKRVNIQQEEKYIPVRRTIENKNRISINGEEIY